jgi:hypothetical protein
LLLLNLQSRLVSSLPPQNGWIPSWIETGNNKGRCREFYGTQLEKDGGQEEAWWKPYPLQIFENVQLIEKDVIQVPSQLHLVPWSQGIQQRVHQPKKYCGKFRKADAAKRELECWDPKLESIVMLNDPYTNNLKKGKKRQSSGP